MVTGAADAIDAARVEVGIIVTIFLPRAVAAAALAIDAAAVEAVAVETASARKQNSPNLSVDAAVAPGAGSA